MKNQSILFHICTWFLFLTVTVSYARAFPPTSTTNLTICNNQLPYTWNNITCLTAGTYTATLTTGNGQDSIAILHLTVNNVGTSITNAVICDDQLPYHWNGQSFTGSGTYAVTLTSSNGCDSVPILSLTVNHVVHSTTTRVICNNQLPFNWNGNNYSSAGTYAVVLTSAAGCDSIATLNLTVNHVSSSTTSVSACSNDLPFHWNGNTYTTAGTYSLSFINSNGCDSTATLVLSVIPPVTSHTYVTVCTNQLPYTWNGNNYTFSGNFPVILTSASGCDSTAILHLNTRIPTSSTTNITICTGQLPFTWNSITCPASGTYSTTLTGTNGCDSVATLQLTTVSFLTSTTSLTVCSAALPYIWNGVTCSAAGNYSASFVTSAGCDSVATLHLFVQNPSVITDSLSLCESSLPFNWHGQVFASAGIYVFSPPVIIDDCHSVDTAVVSVQQVIPGSTVVTVCSNHLPYVWNGNSYNTTGIYGISLTSVSGCDSLASLNLTVNPYANSTTPISICSNQLPFHWNGSNFNAGGTYTVTLTSSNGCDSIATLELTVGEVTSSTTDITVCNSQVPFIWNGNSYSTNGTYVVHLTNGAGCDSIATLHFVVEPFLSSTTTVNICSNQLPYTWNGNDYTIDGIYSLSLQSNAGCDSIATLELIINDVITSTTTINICSNQLPYTWNGNDYTSTGTYSVSLITAGGCDSVANLDLTVYPVVSSITHLTICNNQLPYSWNGNSYPADGIYLVTLTSADGCDSLATLQLEVTDILTSTTNVNICPALLPYSWNGNNYNTGGTYSVTLVNEAGCDSVPILSLTVVPYVTSTTNITICNNELPYTWNGNTFAAPGTYSVLLTGQSICDSLATLQLTVLPAITSATTVEICASQLPYVWNGNSYSTSGIYQVTLTSSGGCDSIASLQLEVHPTSTSNSLLSVCDSQLPVTWNGNTYSTAGTYTVLLTNSQGCDSLASLQLEVHTTATSTTGITVCLNQLPYSWNANSYAVPGTYSVTLVSSAGCDSIAILHLSAEAVVNSTTNISICTNQLPYSWNGNNYVASGTYNATLVSASGCDSLASLQLTVNNNTSSTTVETVCENQLPFNWNGQSYNTPGIHTVMLVNTAGCDSIASLDLHIHYNTSGSTSAVICDDHLPYIWNGQQYTSTGNYSTHLINSYGCDSVAVLQLTVNPVTYSNNSATVCSSSLPYVWNGLPLNTAGIHTITLTGSSGCDSIASLDLVINPTPPAPNVNNPIVYCQYDSPDPLVANSNIPGASLLWYNVATGGSSSTGTPVVSTVTPGTTAYYVSQVINNCEGPRSVITVTVNSKPALGPDKDIRVCFGETADLSSLYTTNALAASWEFNNELINNVSAVSEQGIYTLTVENASGCKDTALVTLNIQPEVFANAGSDADAEYNIPYQLTGSGGDAYNWSPASVLNNPFAQNPLATLTSNTTFILTVSDNFGCTATDTVAIRVLKGPTFYVPTAFSPNGDGLNDVFKPTPVGIATLEFFRVYNRFGELVFETHEIGKGWDGTYKSMKQNIGNYVWSVQGIDRTGKLKTLKGNVVLIR